MYTVTSYTIEQIIYDNNRTYEDPKDAKKECFVEREKPQCL